MVAMDRRLMIWCRGGAGNLELPPASILSQLYSAVPSDIISEALATPTVIGSIVSEIEAGTTPAWYSSLPPDVKSYLSSAYATLGDTTATTSGSASETSTTESATETSSDESTTTESETSTTESATESSSDEDEAASTSDSTDAAPAPTGNALGMSVAGAAGIVGLALAL